MKILKSLIAFSLIASSSAFAAGEVESNNTTSAAEAEPNVYFDEAEFLQNNPDDWIHQFDLVVVINKNRELWDANKASGNETIDIYQDGRLALRSWVSSGREIPEHADPSNPEAPQQDYFSQTATGFYVPQRLDIDHVSGLYVDAFMPWAVFFNGGTATHRSPLEDLSKNKVDKYIGYRNSGGCVRLHEGVAKQLFWWVRATGGPYTKEELANPHFAKEAREQYAAGVGPRYQTKNQPMPGFSVDGTPTGKLQKMPFKTLYIVENVPVVESPETLAERGPRLGFAKKTFKAFQLPTGKLPMQPVDLSNAQYLSAIDPASLPAGNIPAESLPQVAEGGGAQPPPSAQPVGNYPQPPAPGPFPFSGFFQGQQPQPPPPRGGYYGQPPPGYYQGRPAYSWQQPPPPRPPQQCFFIFCNPY